MDLIPDFILPIFILKAIIGHSRLLKSDVDLSNNGYCSSGVGRDCFTETQVVKDKWMRNIFRQNGVSHLTAIIIIIGLSGACSSQKKYLDFGQVRTGNHLDKAREVKLDTFVTIWLENTRPFKVDMNLNELYKDTIFTYFGKQTFRDQELIKIKRDELQRLDYKAIHGDSIRSKFYHEIIPAKDKNKAERKGCSTTMINIDYKYKLIEKENVIEVRCHYKVTCEFMIRIIKADYYAKYDLRTRSFIKI
jgi:hypothetical protein